MISESTEQYRTLMGRLATAHARYDRERQELADRHAAALTAADEQLNRADESVIAAQTRVRSARALVQQVDGDATELWHSALRYVPRRLAQQLAGLPEPVAIHSLPTGWSGATGTTGANAGGGDRGPEGDGIARTAAVGHEIESLLSAGYEEIIRTRKRGQLSSFGYVVLALLSVASAALVGLIAWAIMQLGRQTDPPLGAVLAIGRILLLLGCFAGIPAAKWYADRRGAQFSHAVIAVVLGSGIVTVSVLALALLL